MFFTKKKKIDIIVYTVPGCHLCDDAIALLHSVQASYNLHIEIIDILSDMRLTDKYQYDVPVVFANEAELFRHRIDLAGLKKRLKEVV